MTGHGTPSIDILQHLRAAFAPHGIFLRGVVHFADDDAAPRLATGAAAASVVLLGNIGGSCWLPFTRWRSQARPVDHPLDRWSKAVIVPVADTIGATAYFPSDPPFQPFQQWAMWAEGLQASPLGILIHPEYGLWHGYRGALGFPIPVQATKASGLPHPCETCAERPCLSSCPAGAILPSGFQYEPCRTHLRTRQGIDGCMRGGCMARNRCPVGATFRYPAEQLAFHMAALGY